MSYIDEEINDHNQKKFKDWTHNEKITLELINDLTKGKVKIIIEGSFIDCKNCRDKILYGWHWEQSKMSREKIE